MEWAFRSPWRLQGAPRRPLRRPPASRPWTPTSWWRCSARSRRCTASRGHGQAGARAVRAPRRAATTATPSASGPTARTGDELLPPAARAAGLRRGEGAIFVALLAKRFGVRPRGWKAAAGPFADNQPRSVADISSRAESAKVRAWKKAQKAEGQSASPTERPAARAAGRAALAWRWRSSQPSRTATARGSWRSWWPAPSMMRSSASPCASASTRRVEGRHRLVVGAVHDQQRPRRQRRRIADGPDLAQLARPGVERRREVRRADDADVAGVLEQPAGVAGPVVEVRRRARGWPRPAPGRPSDAAADTAQRAAGPEARRARRPRRSVSPEVDRPRPRRRSASHRARSRLPTRRSRGR